MRIRHVGIAVRSLERSIEFYQSLGFELFFGPVYRTEPFIGHIVGYTGAKIRIAMVRRGDAVLEILQYIEPCDDWDIPDGKRYRPSSMHVCFEGKDALDVGLKLDGGLALRVGGAIIPDGPQAGAIATYYEGPDRELIELYIPKEEETK